MNTLVRWACVAAALLATETVLLFGGDPKTAEDVAS
jgi:hypothetical protein